MRLKLRLSLFYAALFSTIGVQMPFWPLWLKDRGMDPAQIGMLLAAAYTAKVVVNPLVGAVVDRRGDRRRTMVVLAAASVAANALFFVVHGFPALLATTCLAFGLSSAMMPVAETLTMLSASARGIDYGRVRLWGSLAFIVTAMGGGRLLGDFAPPLILALVLTGQSLTLGAACALPDITATRPKTAPPPLRSLLADRDFLLFLGATSLVAVSHMTYYGFATLHWTAAGLSSTTIGWLWAEGVIAEVVLFAYGADLVRRVGPTRLIVAAAMGASLRWGVEGLTTMVPVLLVVQALHALTFGALHLGAMHFLAKAAPPGLSARAQGLYSSVTNGLVPGVGMLAAGTLYQSLGGGSFLVMALVALGGVALAWRLERRWAAA